MLLAASMVATGASLSAEEWIPSGGRGLGMAGAGIALPNGSQAMNTNPAAIAEIDRFDLAIPGTLLTGVEGDLMEQVDGLFKTWNDGVGDSFARLTDSQQTMQPTDIAKVLDFFTVQTASLGKPGQGAIVSYNVTLNSRWKNYGFYLGQRFYGGALIVRDADFSSLTARGGGAILEANTVNDAEISAATGTNLSTVTPSQEAQTLYTAAGSPSTISAAAIEAMLGSIQSADPAVYSQLTNTNSATNQMFVSIISEAEQANTNTSDPNAAAQDTSGMVLDNDTGAEVRVLAIAEFGLGYGFEMMESRLKVAPVLKIMQGKGYTARYTISDSSSETTDIAEEIKNLEEDKTSTTAFTLDLGLIYEVNEKLSVGLAGRDLTSPSFELYSYRTNTYEDFKLNPQVRAGVGYEYQQKPGWLGAVAFDLDLTPNESSALPGSERQYMAVGVDQEFFGSANIRLGYRKNLKGTKASALSAGLGFQIWKAHLDIAGMLSSDKVKFEGDDVPISGGIAATLGWNMNI